MADGWAKDLPYLADFGQGVYLGVGSGASLKSGFSH